MCGGRGGAQGGNTHTHTLTMNKKGSCQLNSTIGHDGNGHLVSMWGSQASLSEHTHSHPQPPDTHTHTHTHIYTLGDSRHSFESRTESVQHLNIMSVTSHLDSQMQRLPPSKETLSPFAPLNLTNPNVMSPKENLLDKMHSLLHVCF